MKQKYSLLIFLTLAVFILTACGSKGNLVGTWSCELYGSELVIEFTDDGRFIDRTASDIFNYTGGTENQYRIRNGKLEVYVEDDPASVVTLEYRVDGDVLTLGGVEYKRVTLPETAKDEASETGTNPEKEGA